MEIRGVTTIAELELRRHLRSHHTVGTVGAVVLVCSLLSFNLIRITNFEPSARRVTNAFYVLDSGHDLVVLSFAANPLIILFLMGLAALLGATAIVSGREDKSLRTIQALPFDRRTIFVGIVLARVFAVTFVVMVVLGLTFAETHRRGYSPTAGTFFGFAVVLVLHLTGYVAFGAMLSTVWPRRAWVVTVALVTVFGLYVLYAPLSQLVPRAAILAPRELFFMLVAGLDDRWYTAIQVAYGGGNTGLLFSVRRVPVYLSLAVGLIVQLMWIVVPGIVGLHRYETCDLTG